jgi:chromosome condensin MukBEF complex kleisin-like MukF subunit
MYRPTLNFLTSDSGAVTVDWTTLAAAAVGMALATAAMLTGTINMVNSRLDGELRQQQLSDGFVRFTSAHFEMLYATGALEPDAAEQLFTTVNALLNQDILNNLQAGIAALEAGTLPAHEIGVLVALASVASQRNLIPDYYLDYYFGFDGSTPAIASVL